MSIRVWVDVPLRKAEINHVDHRGLCAKSYNTVPELDVTVQNTTVVHELQSRYLPEPFDQNSVSAVGPE